jgi:hypothetical protein
MRVACSFLVFLSLANAVFAQSNAARYGNVPLSFEMNQGQFDQDVLFISRGPGYVLRFRSGEMQLEFRSQGRVDSMSTSLVGAPSISAKVSSFAERTGKL